MVVLSLLAPPIAEFALRFGAAEYFSLSIFGLVIIASVAGKSLLKGLIAGLLGFFCSTIGTDPIAGVDRFTFGQLSLLTGINLLPALIGLFAVSQVLKDAFEYDPANKLQNSPIRSILHARGLLKRCAIGVPFSSVSCLDLSWAQCLALGAVSPRW
ncbi:hypothetical protein HORIV_15090 [Vreelandella olivaria]|uniref:DUF112 domain-containing protein n=1 Tax=Vreelandella olivaria TaxID=390919 RepID=A0ABN5WQ66_9GAMM|nr:hypothetical protein HORIV_15090 [Halomonas olivaria]